MKTLMAVVIFGLSFSAQADDVHACRYGNGSTYFLLDCLTTLSAPEYVRAMKTRQKTAQCHLNAKNKDLREPYRGAYVSACVNRNPAARLYRLMAAR